MSQPDPKVLDEAKRIAERFTEIACMLAGEKPQEWAPRILSRYRVLIGGRKYNRYHDDDLRKAIAAAEVLEAQLRLYGMAEDDFGFQNPDCVGAALSDLPDVSEFLRDQLLPDTAGGPIPDSRRRLCAAVCTQIWRRHRGEVQPYSPKHWEACEAYWQACGQPETSKSSNLNTWQRFCEWAAEHDEDEGWSADFDWQIQYVTRPK